MRPSVPYSLNDCPDGDRIACGLEALKAYFRENVNYPPEALRSSVEGYAVIRFVVERDGRLTQATIIRNPGAGTGEEALRVVEQMNETNKRWLPGMQGANSVRVQYKLPIKFSADH